MAEMFHDETTLLWVKTVERQTYGKHTATSYYDTYLMFGRYPAYFLGSYDKECADGVKEKIEGAREVYIKALNGIQFNSDQFEKVVHRLTLEAEKALGC